MQQSLSHHSVVLHVAGFADRFIFLHDIRLSSKDAVALETAEVLQMPVLALSLSVLVTEDQLQTESIENVNRVVPPTSQLQIRAWLQFHFLNIFSHLVTSSTTRLLAVSVVASTVQLAFLPEVDHVHQQLGAVTAHEASRVPHLVIAGPLCIHGRLAHTHRLLAVMARLGERKQKKDRGERERETVNMAVDWRRSNTPSDVPLTGSILIGDHYLNI